MVEKKRDRAADNKNLRDRRIEAGLVQFRAWCTPAEREQLRDYLTKLRGEK